MVNLAIMRSIMCAEGALCTPECKQQIDSSFVIWFGRKQVFWGERSTFQSKWIDQSLPSPGASSPVSWVGKHSVYFFSLISFPVSYFLSLLICFPVLLIPALLQKHPSAFPLWVCLFLPCFYNTTHITFLCICNPEKRRRRRRRRKNGEENRFYCSALMVFCV